MHGKLFTFIFSSFPVIPVDSKPNIFDAFDKSYKDTPSFVVFVISLKYSLDTSPP